MPVRFERDSDSSGYVEGIERHYYENQVQASHSPFDDTFEFRLAAAVAKDRARHRLVKAIRNEQDRLRDESLTTFRLNYLTSSADLDANSFEGRARQNVLTGRSIDGVEGASDEAIKL